MVQHRSTAHAVIASSTLLFLFVLLRGGGAADAILEPLVAWAKEHVPGGAAAAAATPLFLKATAGLRMLEPAQSEAILESVRATLAGSGFLFEREWAKVIDGTEEGGLGR